MPQSTEQPNTPQQRSLPLQTRIVPVASVNDEARTFETVWTTGARVRRFDWATWQPYIEELSLDPAHIRMTRFENGAPVLNTHQQRDLSAVLGVTEKAWISGTEGRSLCRFSDRDDEVNAYWRDVVNGIIRNISVGYIVHRYEKTDPAEAGGLPVWKAIDWEPAEQSLVPVGADVFSGVRAMGDHTPADRQHLIDAALRAVGNRSFPCELVDRAAPAAAPAPDPVPPTQATAASPLTSPVAGVARLSSKAAADASQTRRSPCAMTAPETLGTVKTPVR